MSFDKQKAMRNAERYLSQGKIRLAISEYAIIIEDNPKDFSTLNILGDLYVKNSEIDEGVNCFRQVAEHYNGQGFASKAIAVYNKISKLKPESMEVAAKLAQLYQTRGSFSEARDQYTRLAQCYQSKGQKIEALAIWKRIAELDPHDTDVYLKIAESCLLEHQSREAAEAFTEAALRLNEQGKNEAAVAAFLRAIALRPLEIKTLSGFVAAKIGLGCADEAAATLENILKDNPQNNDVLNLVFACRLDMEQAEEAEQILMMLVQRDPSHYPKFLDLIKLHLKNLDLDAAVRTLAISSENLMVGGRADEFADLAREVLARNPEHIEALRVLIGYCKWNHDDIEATSCLERLAECARNNEDLEEERNALTQLVMINPANAGYNDRLRYLKMMLGIEDPVVEEIAVAEEVPDFETFIGLNEDEDGYRRSGIFGEDFGAERGEFNEPSESDASKSGVSTDIVEQSWTDDYHTQVVAAPSDQTPSELPEEKSAEPVQDLSKGLKFQKEIESVEFYLAQGYIDLAESCLVALSEEFGPRDELVALMGKLGMTVPVPEVSAGKSDVGNFDAAPDDLPSNEAGSKDHHENLFEQFRIDLGLDEGVESEETDYSTHYQMATAYKEMGLMEEAIKEFQQAINLVGVDDGTRRYFQCANLLGHCFMMQNMPNLALTWYKRALETAGLNDDEIQALNYELATAYEASGEKEIAFQYFEQVYAVDVDYRDISRRIETLRGRQSHV